MNVAEGEGVAEMDCEACASSLVMITSFQCEAHAQASVPEPSSLTLPSPVTLTLTLPLTRVIHLIHTPKTARAARP